MINLNMFNMVPSSIDGSYITDAKNDIRELMENYQFVEDVNYAFSSPHLFCLKVIAVNNDFIKRTHGKKQDYNNEFSKEIIMVIPENYQEKGCDVYGPLWINPNIIPYKHRHVENVVNNGHYKLCVGVSTSFKDFKNPILECVRTAEHIITEYELYMKGKKEKIQIIEYSHKDKGIGEYEKNKKRYKTK